MSAGEHDQEAPPSKKGEEATKETSERTNKVKEAVKEHWSFGLRIVELVLTILCTGLVVETLQYTRGYGGTDPLSHVAIVYSTFSGYIIILGVIIFGRALGEALGWRTSLAFSLIGGILFIAVGGVVISDWTKMTYPHNYSRPPPSKMAMMCASGAFAIINAVVFIVHAGLTWIKERHV